MTKHRLLVFFSLALVSSVFVARCECYAFGNPWNPWYLKKTTTLATFNAALVPFYPEIENRLKITVEQIKQSTDVDIFCLQEVWYADYHKILYNSLKEQFPYALSAIDLNANVPENSPPVCSLPLLQQLGACQAVNCSGLSLAPLFQCTHFMCFHVLTLLPVECLNCLLYSGDQVGICATSPTSRYESTYGLMILSRKKLKNTKAKGFTEASHIKGVLRASVDEVGDILCTHLSSQIGPINVGPPVVSPSLYETYGEQQYAEVLAIFEMAVGKEFPIIIGDMNHGPGLQTDITWYFPIHYGLVNAHGFYSPYVIEDGRCTWCIDNPTTASFLYNLIIDHIYITTSTSRRMIRAERFLDTISTPSGVPLSDHYAVKITLKNYRKNCNWFEKLYYFCESLPEFQSMDQFPIDQQLTSICKAT